MASLVPIPATPRVSTPSIAPSYITPPKPAIALGSRSVGVIHERPSRWQTFLKAISNFGKAIANLWSSPHFWNSKKAEQVDSSKPSVKDAALVTDKMSKKKIHEPGGLIHKLESPSVKSPPEHISDPRQAIVSKMATPNVKHPPIAPAHAPIPPVTSSPKAIDKTAGQSIDTAKPKPKKLDDKQGVEQVRGQVIDSKKVKKSKDAIKIAEDKIAGLREHLKSDSPLTEKVDRNMMLASYPEFLKIIADIEPESKRIELQEQYAGLMNEGYVYSLLAQIEENCVNIPEPFQHILREQGFDESQIQNLFSPSSDTPTQLNFKLFLEGLLEREDLSKISPLDFVQKGIQPRMRSILAHKLGLNEPQAKRLKIVMSKLMAFENDINLRHQKLVADMKAKFGREFSTAEIEKFNPPPMFDQCLEEVLNDKRILSNIAGSEVDFQNFIIDIDRKIDAEKSQYSSQFAKVANKAEWFLKYSANCKFSFDQSSWGTGHMMGEGVCLSIAYRWVKELMKNPTKALSSPDDLAPEKIAASASKRLLPKAKVPTSSRGREEIRQINATSGISVRDRMDFALYLLAGGISIPKGILKRDNLQSVHLLNQEPNPPKNIDELITFLASNKSNELRKSSGVIQLAAFSDKDDSEGHALALQIDSQNNIYRLLDPNHGVYQFDSLEQLKIATKSYMKDVYYRESYNSFDVVQYIPK